MGIVPTQNDLDKDGKIIGQAYKNQAQGKGFEDNADSNGIQGVPAQSGNTAPGGGVAGGQTTTYLNKINPLNYTGATTSDIDNWQYVDPSAYQDQNTGQIYSQINDMYNNRANQTASQASNTPVGYAATLGPLATTQAAQLAPTMMLNGGAQLNNAGDAQLAAAQAQSINSLNATANGQGPSVAATQAHQAAQQNISNQIAALGSQRGSSNPALAQRMAAMGAGSANQQAAATGALGKSQEAIAAQNAVTSALSGARSQGQSQSSTQANLDQAAATANQNAALTGATTNANLAQSATTGNATAYNAASQQQAAMQQQETLQQASQNQQTSLANLTANQQQNQLNDQVAGQAIASEQGQNQTDISNQVALQQELAQQQSTLAGLDTGVGINNSNNAMGLAGAGIQGVAALGGAAAMMAMSDRKAKTKIAMTERPLMNFLAMFGNP